MKKRSAPITIREARPDEYAEIGELTARTYEAMDGMPTPELLPEYYDDLRDVAGRAAAPANQIVAAYGEAGELLGAVAFVRDLVHYGAPIPEVPNGSGFRVLVVDPAAQGRGIGRALALECIERARRAGSQRVLLHTAPVMKVAQDLYAQLGFLRRPDLDFNPRPSITIMGYVLDL